MSAYMGNDWKNPYIDRVESLPERIVPAESNAVTEEQIRVLRSIAASRDRTFLELGSGSGAHLIERAARESTATFIGFELRYKRAFRTAEKAQQRGIENLIVARTTATLVPEIFLANSLAGVYINFPDPWEKKKWRKHRLLNRDFVAKLQQLLLPGGFLAYKTDHQEYFDETLEMLESSLLFSIAEQSRDLHQSAYAADNVLTEFENLFISKGLPTYYLKAVRR